MTSPKDLRNPEPVPPASQLAALPFVAAVEGYLSGPDPQMDLRVTLHRAMNREGQEYLQQICGYLGPKGKEDRSGSGRMFPVNFGIMGAAFEKGRILRTRHYPTKDELLKALQRDMKTTGDTGDITKKRLSWLAIPFLGPEEQPALVLFADTFEFDFFADNDRTRAVVSMCWGFCRLIDALEEDPFPNLRNFAFSAGEKVKGVSTVYPSIQEEVQMFPVPRFQRLRSFNYEASVS